jgi:hypothetical protein
MYAHFWDRLLPELDRLERMWSIPYIWNCKEQRFHLIRRLPYMKRFRALSIFFTLHILFIYWNLLQTLRNETNILLMIYGLGYTGITSAITVVRWMYQSQHTSGEIVKCLNAAVHFQKLIAQPGKIHGYRIPNIIKVHSVYNKMPTLVCYLSEARNLTIKAVRLLMIGMNVAIIFMEMGTVLVAILAPRIPPFFGYYLCRIAYDIEALGDPCRIRGDLNIQNLISFRISYVSTLFGILNGIISFAIYTPGMHMAKHMATHEVLPSLIFQKDCLFQFQAEITHANVRDGRKTMGKYRQLQLLNIMFNEIYHRDFFAIFMAASIMIMVPSGYLLITSYHLNQIILIGLVLITIAEYAIIITLFIMASKIWNASKIFRNAWRTNHRLSSRPLTRRYGASLQNLKIKIGSSNFVEQNTPFVFLSFCIEQTITLVLLNNF